MDSFYFYKGIYSYSLSFIYIFRFDPVMQQKIIMSVRKLGFLKGALPVMVRNHKRLGSESFVFWTYFH